MAARSILVVEDDGDIRSALCSILAEEGYTVIEAHNGYEGLRRAQPAEGMPDILYFVTLGPERGFTAG